MKLNHLKVPFETILYAIAVDQLKILVWAKTKDALKGRNKPKSIAQTLLGDKSDNNQTEGFTTKEEFEKSLENLRKEVD